MNTTEIAKKKMRVYMILGVVVKKSETISGLDTNFTTC